MVSGFISRLVILIFGTLYPAYASYKAVRTKNVKEYVKWMMYWIVFALFTCAETFTDLFLSFWFPFYYEIKIITVIYLLSPATKGSSILYRKFVHPVLTKKEQEIDEYIAKAKEQGYHTVLNLGSKGVNYATSLIMQTAIKGLPSLPITPSSDFLPTKSTDIVDFFDIEDDCSIKKELSENSLGQGGGGLMNQLRKSYSLSDLVSEQDGTVTDGEGPRRIRRNLVHNAGQISENYDGFYYPGSDFYGQTVDANGETVFSEDLSSGYSSGDPLHYDMRRPKGEVLVRTASLGPSSRTRTRAYTKNALPKRTSFSEGGSTWSALESHESQNETDSFNFHLSHSASYPFPLTSCDPYFFSGYPYLIRNNKMFTFSNHSAYSQVLNNDAVAFQNVLAGLLRYENNGNSKNNSILFLDENSDKSTATDPKSDVSNVIHEAQVDDNIECFENPRTESIKEEEKKITDDGKISDLDTEKEKGAEEHNLILVTDESLNEKEKSCQQRSGRYNKKPAPTPPAEESVSKLSDLTPKDESYEFYTPDSSPRPSRKQSLSEVDMTTDKTTNSGSTELLQPKTQTAGVAEEVKKVKTKKGDFNISKKLHLPKMPFTFWDQKGGKQTSSTKTSSVGNVEIATTKSESQNNDKGSVAPLAKNNNHNGGENNETLVLPAMQPYPKPERPEERKFEGKGFII